PRAQRGDVEDGVVVPPYTRRHGRLPSPAGTEPAEGGAPAAGSAGAAGLVAPPPPAPAARPVRARGAGSGCVPSCSRIRLGRSPRHWFVATRRKCANGSRQVWSSLNERRRT